MKQNIGDRSGHGSSKVQAQSKEGRLVPVDASVIDASALSSDGRVAASRPRVALVGRFQQGKSTFVNCMLDDRVARTGDGLRTTGFLTTYTFEEVEEVVVHRPSGDDREWDLSRFVDRRCDFGNATGATVGLWKPLLRHVDFIDTPGFDADADDDATALVGIEQASLTVVLLANRALGSAERTVLRCAQSTGKPYIVVVNCIHHDQRGQWAPESNQNMQIFNEIRAELARLGCKPETNNGDPIWPCNLIWFWMASGHLARDGDAYQSLKEDTREAVSHHFKGRVPSAREFAAHSYVLPLRHFLADYPWSAQAPLEALGLKALREAQILWAQGMAKVFDRAR
jgi:hypothetical protein